MRLGMTMIRLYAPGAITMVVAAVILAAATRLQASPYTEQMAEPFGVAAQVVATIGFGWICWGSWRLFRWMSGEGHRCQWCDGPAGFKRDGKVFFGRHLSDYRKCLSCNRANPEI